MSQNSKKNTTPFFSALVFILVLSIFTTTYIFFNKLEEKNRYLSQLKKENSDLYEELDRRFEQLPTQKVGQKLNYLNDDFLFVFDENKSVKFQEDNSPVYPKMFFHHFTTKKPLFRFTEPEKKNNQLSLEIWNSNLLARNKDANLVGKVMLGGKKFSVYRTGPTGFTNLPGQSIYLETQINHSSWMLVHITDLSKELLTQNNEIDFINKQLKKDPTRILSTLRFLDKQSIRNDLADKSNNWRTIDWNGYELKIPPEIEVKEEDSILTLDTNKALDNFSCLDVCRITFSLLDLKDLNINSSDEQDKIANRVIKAYANKTLQLDGNSSIKILKSNKNNLTFKFKTKEGNSLFSGVDAVYYFYVNYPKKQVIVISNLSVNSAYQATIEEMLKNIE